MELRLDFAADDRTTGFRLRFFELYNWGTYNKRIERIEASGANALLTGDIGSGKSTVVDALTTLLVPHQKITYNKAAGAGSKERTLYSYVVGEYKSTQDEQMQRAKSVSLRGEGHFTVLLANFYNEGFEEQLTLAQFFYIISGKVQKFFVVSRIELEIARDFLKFEDVKSLKKRLRNREFTEVYDTFKEYSIDFRRAMGIKSEQALNLFYQTVSMKSIGDLTDFIRTHMLEAHPIEVRIGEICTNFAELNHTYDMVRRAREQIEMLKPIEKEAKKFDEDMRFKEDAEVQLGTLGLYIATYKKELLSARLEALRIELEKLDSRKRHSDVLLEQLGAKITTLKIELEKSGGNRLEQIEGAIAQLSKEMARAKKHNEHYNGLVKQLGHSAVSNEHTFLSVKNGLSKEIEAIETEQTKLQNAVVTEGFALQKYRERERETKAEIAYLKAHRSNIPQRISAMRQQIAEVVGVPAEELPFVGELVKVEDAAWEGAINRVLHSFALSMLVEESLYERVSDYIERTDLKGRLVYLKVDRSKVPPLQGIAAPNSILEKIAVKADSAYFDVVRGLLYERFDIACVERMEEFRRYKKALTIHGQLKTSLTRHEKDDRHAITDRSRWVMGWENADKLKAYEADLEALKEKIALVEKKIADTQNAQEAMTHKRDAIRDILRYEQFDEIDWYSRARAVEALKEEAKALQESSDIIRTLQASLAQTQQAYEAEWERNGKLSEEKGSINNKIEAHTEELGEATLLVENGTIDEEIHDALEALREKIAPQALHLGNIKSVRNGMEKVLKDEIYKFAKRIERSTQKLLHLMSDYVKSYPVETKEFDASIASLGEFRERLKTLKKDNLPKYEKKFRALLKEKTIQDMIILQSTLEEYAEQIENKITAINTSLTDIEYNEGTYIELEPTPSKNSEIKQFRQELKSVISGAIDEENEYSEEKFLQIKQIIDRFNGREGYADIDKRWKDSVTDVRNWYDFSAKEKYISDHSLKEYYAHSGGKSGGQKEKLAYTVLASSLAYQFGLEYGAVQSRSFRFVMIDEAFGKGSDESTRYALRLFEKLNLQLLVITPKTKINVIEPYVRSIHFVFNRDGMDSGIVSMDIERYQAEKKRAAARDV